MWNLISAITAGARHLTQSFDPQKNDIPWFEIRLEENLPGYMFHFDTLDIPHAPGRALDAMLAAETVTDFITPPDVIEKYKKAIRLSLNGEDAFPGDRSRGGNRQIYAHNFREMLLAANALVRYRHDDEARLWGDRLLSALLEIEQGSGAWDPSAVASYVATHGHPELYAGGDLTTSEGRLIYALLQWYQSTKDDRAVLLAHRLGEKLLSVSFDNHGYFTSTVGAHVHSITSSFSGLCDLALFDQKNGVIDTARIEKLEKILFHSILPLSSEGGWVKELRDRPGMGGEVNSTGDIIQAFICLYQLTKKSDYLHRAEQMIRSHLLPAQVMPESIPSCFLCPPTDDTDKYHNILERLTGGFGFPTPEERAPLHYDNPYCRITTLDITGGAVQALIRVTLFVAEKENETFHLHFLLPIKQPGLSLEQLSLDTFRLKTALRTSFRCPPCKNLAVNGKPFPLSPFITLEAGVYELHFTFPPRIIKENLFGNLYETTFIGEQAVTTDRTAKYSDMFDYIRKFSSLM